MFCRPMFVHSLALAEIAAADEKRRISLVVSRQLDAIADIEGIFREMQARGDEQVVKNLEHMPNAVAGLRSTHAGTTPARSAGIPRITSRRCRTNMVAAGSTRRTA
jgi:hypothetical protein